MQYGSILLKNKRKQRTALFLYRCIEILNPSLNGPWWWSSWLTIKEVTSLNTALAKKNFSRESAELKIVQS